MSYVFYEALEKSASVRVMRALNEARLGRATKKQLALLERRGMPTNALGSNLKIRDMLDQTLQSAGDAGVKATRNRVKNEARGHAMDALLGKIDQKVYGDAPDAIRFGKEYDYAKSVKQKFVDKARDRQSVRELGGDGYFANVQRRKAYDKLRSELVGGHSRSKRRGRSQMSISDAYAELKRTRRG